MNFPLHSIYLLYTTILAVIMIVLVPRTHIRTLALLGVFYGGILNLVVILIHKLTGAGGFQNYGPFHFLGIPFLPPIAWTVFFIIFLYLLPGKKPWNYLFAVVASCYSVFFSNVLANLGIFQWKSSPIIYPIIVYLTWFLLVTWSYTKYGKKIIHKFDYDLK